MGAWGPGLWSDDTACDVRTAYREALEDGLADAEAQAKVLSDFAADLADADSASVVWLALAAAQARLGRLDPRVRDHAVDAIDSGSDIRRWEHDPSMRKKRETVLVKLRQELVGRQRPPTKVRRPARVTTSLIAGDVLSYRAPSGRHYLLAVRAVNASRYGTFPIVHLLDFEGTSLPARLDGIGDRQAGVKAAGGSPAGPWWKVSGQVTHKRGHDFADHGFTLEGRVVAPGGSEQERLREHPGSYSSWDFWRRYLDRQDELLGQRLAAD